MYTPHLFNENENMKKQHGFESSCASLPMFYFGKLEIKGILAAPPKATPPQ